MTGNTCSSVLIPGKTRHQVTDNTCASVSIPGKRRHVTDNTHTSVSIPGNTHIPTRFRPICTRIQTHIVMTSSLSCVWSFHPPAVFLFNEGSSWHPYGDNLPSLPTPFFILFLCLFLSLQPFQLYFIPQILLTTLCFLALFFQSYFRLFWSFQLYISL